MSKMPVIIGSYQLIDHHISIYKTLIDNSQYHYTAYFEDEQKNKYRLHVYYKSNDLLNSLGFEHEKDTDRYVDLDVKDLDVSLLHLSNRSTIKVIGQLRLEQERIISDLDKQYSKLEVEISLLAEDIFKNQKEYITRALEIKRLLEHIIPYTNDYQRYNNLHKYFSLLIANLDSLKEESKLQPTQDVESTNPGYNEEKIQKPKLKIKKALSIASDLKNFTKTLNALLTNGLDDNVQSLIDTYNRALNLQTIIFCDDHLINPQELNDLNMVVNKLSCLAIQYLEQQLLKSNFDTANMMSMFFTKIDHIKIMLHSLKTYDANLFEFLMKHLIIPERIFEFTLNNTIYYSLMDYFIKTSLTESKAVDLAIILVKYRSEILFDLDEASGAPYAALLLLDKKQPLWACIEKNADQTLYDLKFYTKLNQILHTLPLDSPIDIKKLIELNKFEIQQIKPCKIMGRMDIIDQYHKHTQRLENTPMGNIIERVKRDPKIQELDIEHDKKFKMYMEMLPKDEKKNIGQWSQNINEEFFQLHVFLNKYNLVCSFEEYHHLISTSIQSQIDLIDCKLELASIQKQIENRNLPKRHLEPLLKRQSTLNEAISDINQRTQITQKGYALFKLMVDSLDLCLQYFLSSSGFRSQTHELQTMKKLFDNALGKDQKYYNGKTIQELCKIFSVTLGIVMRLKEECVSKAPQNMQHEQTNQQLSHEEQQQIDDIKKSEHAFLYRFFKGVINQENNRPQRVTTLGFSQKK